MNINDFLVSTEPQAFTVTLPDGTSHTLHYLTPTAADIRRWHAAETSSDEEQRIYAMQQLIAACLYDPQLQRRVFSGKDENKHRQLSYAACNAMLPPILKLADITPEKKA